MNKLESRPDPDTDKQEPLSQEQVNRQFGALTADFFPMHNDKLDDTGINTNQTPLNNHPSLTVATELGGFTIRTTSWDPRNMLTDGIGRGNSSSSAHGFGAKYYTSKSDMHKARYGYKNGPTFNPTSDYDMQKAIFPSLVSPEKSMSKKLKYDKPDVTKLPGRNKAEGGEGVAVAADRELQENVDHYTVAQFVTQYLKNAGIELSYEDTGKLAEALRASGSNGTKKDRRVEKFDEILSEAATRAHMVYELRKGGDPTRSLDDPSKSAIPVAVQRRVRIVPSKRRDESIQKKGGKLQRKRFVANAELSFHSAPDFSYNNIKDLPRKARKEEQRRLKKVATFKHHAHHADHKLEDLAFGKNKLKIGKSVAARLESAVMGLASRTSSAMENPFPAYEKAKDKAMTKEERAEKREEEKRAKIKKHQNDQESAVFDEIMLRSQHLYGGLGLDEQIQQRDDLARRMAQADSEKDEDEED